MATIINADTSDGLKFTSDTSGEIKLQSAGTDIATVNSSGVSATTFIPTSSTVPTNGVYLPTTNTVGLATNSTERMRIDASGNLIVGSAVSTVATGNISIWGAANTKTELYLQKNTQVEAHFGFKTSTDNSLWVGTGTGIGNYGTYQTNLGNSWNSVSDERLKDIIEPIENASDKVCSLRAVIGKYKNDPENTRRAFLIAQDVQAVLPEAVNVADQETGTLGMSYTDTIPLLVAAIKEQQDIIKALETRIQALENA